MPQLLGAKLRWLRRQQGVTQVQLAQQVGLASYTHITKIEAGQRAASLALIVRFADVLSVSTDYLLRDQTPVDRVISWPSSAPAGAAPMRLLGPKLKHLRLRHNETQIGLARRLGLARPGYISNIEAGRKEPSPELTVQIADLFGITTDYLLRDALSIEDVSDVS